MVKEETTFYRFYSEIKAFLTKLMNKPIQAEPSKYLKDRDFTKDRLIRLFMKEGILERDEKILTPNKDNVKNVQYNVKYRLKNSMNGSNSKTFENKIEDIHKKYFGGIDKQLNEELNMYSCPNIIGVCGGRGGIGSELCDRWAGYVNDAKDKPRTMFKNEEDMKKDIMKNKKDAEVYKTRGGMKIDECDCGGCCGGDVAGATNAESSGQFVQPLGGVQKREMPAMLATKQKKDKDYVDPTKILGKTINESTRKVTFTKEQMDYIMKANGVEDLDEATTCGSVGGQYTTPGFNMSGSFWKTSKQHHKKGGISCDRIGKKK